MKYILDSSVAIKWVLSEVDSATAIRLRDEYKRGVHELLDEVTAPAAVQPILPRAERAIGVRA